MHIAPYDNLNKPIVDIDNEFVPLNYFNIVKLKRVRSSNILSVATRRALSPQQELFLWILKVKPSISWEIEA